MICALDALKRLREGNDRFIANALQLNTGLTQARREELSTGQKPSAIILGCSDSRVPAEIVFDHGLGDLFVIRIAGNIVAPSQIGSVEFAATRFGTRLVVVLGHSQCGAVLATLEELKNPAARHHSANLRSITDRIRPSIERLIKAGTPLDSETFAQDAIRANISASAHQLRHGSPVLDELIQTGDLLVVGAEYSLETGRVVFFDGVPKD